MTSIVEQVRDAHRLKREAFAQQMARPAGGWWERFKCSLAGGHHWYSANFPGQQTRFCMGIPGRTFYYGKCPRCGWHVFYDSEIHRWFETTEPPAESLLAPLHPMPPAPPPPLPPDWGV